MKLASLAALTAAAILPGAARPAAGRAVPRLSHVVVIVFENKDVHEIDGNPAAPTFNRLARSGARLQPYSAVTHPSLPNYLALVSGSTQGIRDDCTSCVVDAPSLADTLHAAGRTWKTYAEGIPAPGFTGGSYGSYAKWHVPFLYFRHVLERPSWRRRVQPLRELTRDLHAGRLPDYSLVVPDLCHDMHDCSVGAGDGWLAHWLPILSRSRQLRGGAIFVLFDEGSSSGDAGGRIAGYVVGRKVHGGASTRRAVTHYRVLATIEAALQLPLLGLSRSAPPISGIWR